MNRCYGRLAELRSKLAEAEAHTRTNIAITDELVLEVIQSARRHLEEGSPKEIKVLLRDLITRVEISGEEVALHYTFRNPDTKVAGVLAQGLLIVMDEPGQEGPRFQ